MGNPYCDATPAANGAWITRRKLNDEAKVRLICFPYAGGGAADQTKREQLMPWSDHTTSTFTLRMFQGDHFFLHTAELKILEIIAQKLVGTMIEPY